MNKNVWLLIGLVTLSLIFSSPCGAGPQEPDGFGGIRWGDEASTIDGLTPTGVSDHLVVYRKSREITHFGGAALEAVEYYFYFGKFMGARLSLRGFQNFATLKKHLIAVYGPGKQRNFYLPRFTWLAPSVLMALNYSAKTDSGSFLCCYLPLWNQVERSEKDPLPLLPLP
jgi:hypothetical protein